MGSLRLVLSCLAAAAVSSACAAPKAPPAETTPVGRVFVAERAYEDVSRLVAIGPRPNGGEGAARAREYLRGQLEALGLTVEELEIDLPEHLASDELKASPEGLPRFVHVEALIPGRGGSGEILLLAGYDTAPTEEFENVAANGAASGPAVVLELARAIAADPLHYPTRVVFLDGDLGGADRERVGSRLWARTLLDSGKLDDFRMAMFFRQVCDPDLRFERDLFSHTTYREAVWRAAKRTGHTDAFSPDADFGTPSGSHHSLMEGGMRRGVAIIDDSFGGTESPGALAGTAEDDLAHCSAESLGVTGEVALQALGDVTRMLAKVDRLSPEEEPEEVESEGASASDAPGEEEATDPPAAEEPAGPAEAMTEGAASEPDAGESGATE